MAIGTRKSNANVRPGRIVLENSRRRRTRKQIEEDNARANAAAVAEREEEEGRNKRIAELEDGIERDEEQVRTHANRPDLRYQPTRGSTEEEGDIPADSNKDFESDESDVYSPPASTVLNSSSGSDGDDIASENDLEEEFEPQVLSETVDINEDDENRMMVDIEGDSNSQAMRAGASVTQVRKKSKKKKAERGELRAAVGVLRTVPNPSSSNGKRKASPEVPQDVHKRLKRSNAMMIGGLSANWKARVLNTSTRPAIVKAKSLSDTTSGGGHSWDGEARSRPGELISDEHENMLKRVEASKGTTPGPTASDSSESVQYVRLKPAVPAAGNAGNVSVARKTEQMRVKLMKIMSPHNQQVTSTPDVIESNNEMPGASRKQGQYTAANLPFPGGGNHRRVWAKDFRRALLCWAGSQEDPFGTSGIMHQEISRIWGRLYPDIELDAKKMGIVVYVCDTMLTSWRSEIGKDGISAVEALWDSNKEEYGTEEQRREYAKKTLHGLKYLYEFPDRTTERGAFCSELVSAVFSSHLKKVVYEMDGYGPQIGALALAAVSVERGFTLYRQTGIDIRKINGKLRIYDFADDPWGLPARNLTKRSQGLSAESWMSIIDHAAEFLSENERDILMKRNSSGDNGDSGIIGDLDLNQHAYIDLDWCVS